MKIQVRLILSFLLFGGLTSCDIIGRFNPSDSNSEIQRQYQAVSVLLTETAQVLPAPSLTPTTALFTATPEAVPTQGVTATRTIKPLSAQSLVSTPTQTVTQEPRVEALKAEADPCDRAQPGRPIDITVPDDTSFHPGEYFSKTWRLVNAGNCPWTRDYAVVWFSGNDLGLNRFQSLSAEVKPGSAVDLTIDMVAPQAPGTYQSNWKMRNQRGELFGIGSNGDAPFWVRIVVLPVNTPTSTLPVPTITPTTIVSASGILAVQLGQGVDLDSGQINQADNDDVAFQRSADGKIYLAPLNGTRLMLVGIDPPEMADCYLGGPGDAPVALEQYQVGFYLCYRTTKGLPGRLTIPKLDLENGQFEVKFTTWAVQ